MCFECFVEVLLLLQFVPAISNWIVCVNLDIKEVVLLVFLFYTVLYRRYL
jgi:hypothetical protein